MEYPKHIDTISLGSPFCVLRGHRLKFLNYDEFMLLKIFFIQASSADPDECLYAAFYLGLHCLPKYLFISISNEKDYKHFSRCMQYVEEKRCGS